MRIALTTPARNTRASDYAPGMENGRLIEGEREKVGVHLKNGTATREMQSRIVLERDVCAECGIEPRLIDGFVCGIDGCLRKTKKIKKPLTDWLARKK